MKASLQKAQQTLAKAQKVLKQAPERGGGGRPGREELERLRDELAKARSAAEETAAATPVETTGATTPVDPPPPPPADRGPARLS